MGRRGEGWILLAEDDRDQSEVLAEFLAYEGYQVTVASTPDEVLKALPLSPDLVLLDVNGVATPAVIRALAQPLHRPALVLVSADFRIAELAMAFGADAHLEKPYDLAALVRTITSALSSRIHRGRDASEAMLSP